MKIEQLTVDGFGHFHDREFGPLNERLTVFHGPNEAGKSTLLEFLRTMLFGFDRGWRSTYPPLTSGRHGGRAILADDDGRRYSARRTAGPNGGDMELVDETDGSAVSEVRLRSMLGGASRGMYGSVFAFSLEELQNVASLDRAEVDVEIYSAGMGARHLPQAMKALAGSRDRLFKKSGSTQEIAAIRDELREVEAGLARVAGEAEEYGQLQRRQRAIERELHDLREGRAELAGRRDHYQRLNQAWPDWISRENLRQELASMPERAGFPVDAVIRLERLEAELKNARANREEAERELAQAEAEASREIPDRGLLELAAEVEEVRQGLGRYRAFLDDLPKRHGDLNEMRRKLGDTLADLGAGWDVERIGRTDTSAPVTRAIEDWQGRLRRAEDDLRAAAERAANARLAREQASEAAAEAVAELEKLGEKPAGIAEIPERRRGLRTARSLLQDYIVAKGRVEEAERMAPPPTARPGRWPAIVLMLAAALALGGGILAGGVALAILAGVAALVAGVSGWMLLQAQAARPDPAVPPAIVEAAGAALEAFENHARRMDIAQPDWASIEEAEAAVERLEDLAARWARAEDGVQAAGRDLERATAALRREMEAQERAETANARARQGWEEWLSGQGLPPGISPQAATATLAQVRVAASHVRAVQDIEHRVKRILDEVALYRTRVERLVAGGGLDLRVESDTQLPAVVQAVLSRFDAAREAAGARDSAVQRLRQAETAVAARKEREEEAAAELAGLLARAKAADAEELRTFATDVEARATRERELRDCEERLQQLSGRGSGYQRLLQELAATQPEAISAGLEGTSGELDATDARVGDLREELGQVTTRLADLASDEKGSQLRATRETLIARLETRAREWARVRLAEELLERARSQHERERQPEVITTASGYLAAMTNGRYTRIHVPLDAEKRTVLVSGDDTQSKEPADLSRGTREQLYLALRFGLIEHFGKDGARLPVIVDDALVNFDPARAAATARAFTALSERNQVIVFTCHPHLVEIFRESYPPARVIEIGDGLPERAAPPSRSAQLL